MFPTILSATDHGVSHEALMKDMIADEVQWRVTDGPCAVYCLVSHTCFVQLAKLETNLLTFDLLNIFTFEGLL